MYPRPENKPHWIDILDKWLSPPNRLNSGQVLTDGIEDPFLSSILAEPVQAIDISADIADDMGIVQPHPGLVVIVYPSLGEIGRGDYHLFSVDHIDLGMQGMYEQDISTQPPDLILDIIAHSRAVV